MQTKVLSIMVLAACFSCGLAAVPTIQPQYAVGGGALPYVDLVSPTPLALGDDALSSPLPLPPNFDFRFFGTYYKDFRVGSNGYVLLSGPGTTSGSPEHSTHGFAVSPLWADLDVTASSQGQIGWSLQTSEAGTLKNAILVVEWKNVPLKGAAGVGVRMQLIFIRDMDTMECRYGLPEGMAGATTSAPHAVAISKAPSTPNNIFDGELAGFMAQDGSVTAYPAGKYLRFSKNPTPLSSPFILQPGPLPSGGTYPPSPGAGHFPLPDGTSGISYQLQFSFTAGVLPYSVTTMTLPGGWSLSMSGLLSAPAAAVVAGTYDVEFMVDDSSGATLATWGYFKVTINAPTLSIVSPAILPAGNEAQVYGYTFHANGGTPYYTWSSANLPAGFSLSVIGRLTIPASCALAGNYTFDIDVHDAAAPAAHATLAASLTILPPGTPLSITSPSALPSGVEGNDYSYSCTAVGGQPPYTWAASGLPAGWTVSVGGQLDAPAAMVSAGTFNFSITVSDGQAAMVTSPVSVVIDMAPPILIATSTLAQAAQGVPYSQTITGAGGTGQGCLWSLVSGALPAGIQLSSSGNAASLTGTAQSVGSYNFRVEFRDSLSHATERDFTLLVVPAGTTATTGASSGGGCSTAEATGMLFAVLALVAFVAALRVRGRSRRA